MSLTYTCDNSNNSNNSNNLNTYNSSADNILKEDLNENESIIDYAKILLTLSKTTENITKINEQLISDNRCCQLCHKTQTPLWRRTKDYHTLCNACGIRQRNINNNKLKNMKYQINTLYIFNSE